MVRSGVCPHVDLQLTPCLSPTRPTSNFGDPTIAVSFALARPGETIDDFQLRINSRGDWGHTRYGREKVEIVLTRESVERLVAVLELTTGHIAGQPATSKRV